MAELKKIPLLTPIESDHHYLLSRASNYFNLFGFLGAKVATPLISPREKLLCEPIEIKTTSTMIALKVCTMILSLGLFPLIALLVIIIERGREDFVWELKEIVQIESEPNAPAEVDKVQELFDRRAREVAQINEGIVASKSARAEQAAERVREEEERAYRSQQAEEAGRRQIEAQELHLANAVNALGSLVNSMGVTPSSAS